MFGASKTASASTGGPADPYFYDVTMLLTGNGTNGAQNNTFLDSSSNAFTITRNGNTTQGSFSPYGSLWSNYFNGSTDYLTATSNAAFAFGTGDFTIEAWIYTTSTSNYRCIFTTRGTASTAAFFGLDTGVLYPVFYTTGAVVTSSIAVTLNAWTHVALVRSSGTATIYVNGVSGGSAANSTNMTSNSATVGYDPSSSGYYWPGYISNLRVVKGTAVYTGAFTPSTTPLTAISGTSLLTCQSNRFIDNSSNAFAITPSGTPSVQRFSPFNPTSAYSTATIGGSMYRDGQSGSTLSLSDASFAVGTGDFTLEGWMYTGNTYFDIAGSSTTGSSAPYGIALNNYLCFVGSAGGAGTEGVSITTTPNAWNYVAMSRSSGTLSVYVNGVRQGTVASTRNVAKTQFSIGSNYTNTDDGSSGYMCGVCFSTIARYSGTTMTVPTAPLASDANTKFLLGFTNAGIPDSAMMNDLETAGGAQVSTSQAKYGTGSMYFNGASGTNLQFIGTPNVSFGTGDFTIEMWVYRTANTQGALITLGQGSGTNGAGLIFYPSTTTLSFVYYSGTNILSDTGSFTNNQWVHVALVRRSGTVYLYVGGVQKSSASFSTWNATGYNCCIGSWFDSASFNYTGYIDDLRITKGYARYTTNFTPPTAAFPTY